MYTCTCIDWLPLVVAKGLVLTCQLLHLALHGDKFLQLGPKINE